MHLRPSGGQKILGVDAGHAGNLGDKVGFGSQPCPFAAEKNERKWGDELLQGPSACEPAGTVELGHDRGLKVARGRVTSIASSLGKTVLRDVFEIHEAYPGVAILCEHGVDGLGQLSRARFVDAVGVDPNPGVSVSTSQAARHAYFLVAGLGWRRI